MKNVEQHIDDFFEAYERRFNTAISTGKADVDGLAGAFADYFVESSPVGVIGGKNDETFRERIPKGYERYRRIGTKSMKIDSKTITFIDEFHVMVKVHWISTYAQENADDKRIEFDVFYFLNLTGDEPKIFGYVTGDEEGVLREKGIVKRES